ncbi:TPA: oligosaccharide flippase family protein [Streptococcus suis]
MNKGRSNSFVKIGMIYTLSNIVIKGMAFLTTPIFTRLMSQEEFGSFSNISSWANIISIIASLGLYSSISRAKYDYDENIKEYMSTITILGSGFTLIVWLLIEIKMEFWEGIFDMDGLYIRSIMLYSLFTPAVQTLITKHRMYNEYKNVIALTWITLLVSTFASLGVTYVMSNKLMGRVIGNYAIIAVVDIVFWIYIIFQGKSFSLRMCKYACTLSLPLLIHELSGVLLNSSDRIIINQLSGAKKAALYSIAYTIAMVITVVLSSLNQAWVPWFFDKMQKNDRESIRTVVPKYMAGFTVGCIGLMIIGPEMVLIFGGKDYLEAMYVIPPVCLAIEIQFAYTLYVNVEFFEKKTTYISLATAGATVINIALNFYAIPRWGYIAAAYTTVIGYLFTFLFHYIVCKKIGYDNLFDKKNLLLNISISIFAMVACLILYRYTWIRRFVLIGILLIVFIYSIKNRNKIINYLSNR